MTHSKLIHDGYEDQINNLIEQRNEARTECDALKAQNTRLITEMSEALGDKTLNSLSQVATGIRDLQAELDALKAERDALLAAQQWQPIESAPKDGTRILIYAADTHEIFSVSWMTAQEDGSQEWIAFRFDQIGAVAIHNATLWQPMPWPEAIAKATGEKS